MKNPRTALVVVGMHRSGTSAVARVLSLLGASLPRHIVPAGLGNEVGHWEPAPAVDLNDRILNAAQAPANALWGPSASWLTSHEALPFVEEMKALIVQEYEDSSLFVFKDPRTTLVFPLWRCAFEALDINVKVVVAFRNPLEVAQSLAKRQTQVFPYQAWPLDRGALLWLRYNLAAERYTRHMTRGFCHYSDMMTDWRASIRRLGEDIDASWPRQLSDSESEIDGFLAVSLRHHHEGDQLTSVEGPWAWIAPVYPCLCAARSGLAVDSGLFDATAQSFDAACRAFEHYVNAMEHRIEQLGSASLDQPRSTNQLREAPRCTTL